MPVSNIAFVWFLRNSRLSPLQMSWVLAVNLATLRRWRQGQDLPVMGIRYTLLERIDPFIREPLYVGGRFRNA